MKKFEEKDLAIGCTHIVKALKSNKKINTFEVDDGIFTCKECAEKGPVKTKKAFMDMFTTICKCCIKKISK